MPNIADGFFSWLRPQRMARGALNWADSEGKAFALLMGGCWILVASQLLNLSSNGTGTAGGEFAPGAAGVAMGTLFLAPLLFYLLSAISGLIARLLNWRVSWRHARVALFWALLAATPLVLLEGIALLVFGEFPALQILSWLTIAFFAWVWVGGLLAAAEADAPAARQPGGM